jgi:hypothetical protein
MILDDDYAIRCDITPKRTRCIIGKPFADPLGNLVTKEEEAGDGPNLEIFEMLLLDLWESGKESGNRK